ncbi:glycoside hydrolase family 105 protein [Paenibacillus thailandensis]|uniref:Glycoside hydrolase family 105 protein n=1 Tax=Paenibacillus thailandensis TaxID=393250 RepID=A0ABW5QRS0_9BACL
MAKKLPYFDEQLSIAGRTGGSDDIALAAVAGRFIGAHPKLPPVYRLYSRQGFRRMEDCRYDIRLHDRFPEIRDGEYMYVWAKLWMDQDTTVPFSLSCYGPATVYINRSAAFASNLNDDVFPDRKAYFRTALRQGWNDIVLEFVKTGTGCGGKFGTGSVKGFPLHVLNPKLEGQEGWRCSKPQPVRWRPEELPGSDGQGSGTKEDADSWQSAPAWTAEQLKKGRFGRIFADAEIGETAYAWTKLSSVCPGAVKAALKGTSQGRCAVYLNGKAVFRSEAPGGSLYAEIVVPYGDSELIVESVRTGEEWGFELSAAVPDVGFSDAGQQPGAADAVGFKAPYPVEGLREPWLYAGPFVAGDEPEAGGLTRMDRPFGKGGRRTFWRADLPDTWVRPYLENAMYGKWNYPLGVTLYGILRTGLALGEPHYAEYAADFIEQSSRMHEYAIWDAEQYGAPGINHQLTLIDSLDDCGSFGAAMLEAHKYRGLQGAEAAAAHIANYISRKQDRLPDGTLYRTRGTTDFMQNTIWCDDLYMSTPFLVKYAELTGEPAYLDDAAQQFMLYREKLYMPDLQIMHHVYDLKHDKPNGVPWGRGNGWVLFSLTELLAAMPSSHRLRPGLVSFFRELCEGYVRLQGDNGLWHQVLTDPESYEEASCTSMFVYAFARGVRFGWLERPARYAKAALKGWEGLKERCIDKHGNVYGVCRGSGYSFSSRYYKDELTWQLNDTHGIGIVLLAGIEAKELGKFLVESNHQGAEPQRFGSV